MSIAILTKEIIWNDSVEKLFMGFSKERHFVLLDSSMNQGLNGRYSFMAFDPFDVVNLKGKDSLEKLRDKLKPFLKCEANLKTPLSAGAIGYLSYDLGMTLEGLKSSSSQDAPVPDCLFGLYDSVITVDHHQKKIVVTSTGLPEKNSQKRKRLAKQRLNDLVDKIQKIRKSSILYSESRNKNIEIHTHLKSNFSKSKYLKTVEKALAYIAQGDIYQVNLSQRFEMEFKDKKLNAIAFYNALRILSPAHFSSYFDAGSFKVISSSPERFLQLQDGVVTARPMKGTRPRSRSQQKDKSLKNEIMDSRKDQAELLMITDLMRNDIGRVCDFGSVRVEAMRTLEKYATVYQTTSTIKGMLSPDKDVFDLLQACFPGGSITGCPKIRAMQIIDELEPHQRGIYTGSLGYIGFDGSMDFNILIRTILMKASKLYFQVGGGIVADSDPNSEYAETLVKAKAMRAAIAVLSEEKNVSSVSSKNPKVLTDPWILHNDKWIHANDKLLQQFTPGIQKAINGVFETMRINGGNVFALGDHVERLHRGAKVFGLKKIPSGKQMSVLIYKVIKKNAIKEGLVRLSFYFENNRNHLVIIPRVCPEYSYENYFKGFRAMRSEYTIASSQYSNVKSLNYFLFRKAYVEAVKNQCHESILFNSRNEIVEGSRSNIFIVRNNSLFTPKVSCGCLNGITRQIVMNLAKKRKFNVRTSVLTEGDLIGADEIFATNSGSGILPITHYGLNHIIGFGHMGPMTRRLRDDYQVVLNDNIP